MSLPSEQSFTFSSPATAPWLVWLYQQEATAAQQQALQMKEQMEKMMKQQAEAFAAASKAPSPSAAPGPDSVVDLVARATDMIKILEKRAEEEKMEKHAAEEKEISGKIKSMKNKDDAYVESVQKIQAGHECGQKSQPVLLEPKPKARPKALTPVAQFELQTGLLEVFTRFTPKMPDGEGECSSAKPAHQSEAALETSKPVSTPESKATTSKPASSSPSTPVCPV